MDVVNYLLNFLFDFAIWILILRFWMQLVRADYYNPLSQFVVKLSNPIVVPLRRIIPGWGGLDIATLLLAYLIGCSKFIVLPLINNGGFDLVTAVFLGLLFAIKQFGFLLIMVMIIMAIMSWVVQGYHPMYALFNQLSQPLLKPIRQIVPTIGGLDLSFIVAFLLINVINMIIGNIIPVWQYL